MLYVCINMYVYTNIHTIPYTDLNHVLLHTCALMTPENGEQFVVGYEEKSRESIPLRVQVVIEALLAPLQPIVNGLEILQPVLSMAGVQH